ncbi:MAG: tRNA (adenosine(37)-N6)-dimethylallyltransferase MiaA [Desulfovibrio sp.]|jgi:tRNA dimethylallyltransferase|nr:tRNA (adenosine(37)-N6)-dimethylallyltransferase MiaA [Desulfovibrio sp.]
MNRPRPDPLFLPCLMGPTGAGKSAAAAALAGILPVSVVNADSRQVYRDFPLITAQPSEEERQACPNRLYGFLPSEKKLGAGLFARAAATSIRQEAARGRTPVLVGGTGLYFKTLLAGIAPIPAVPKSLSEVWTRRCLEEGCAALHALLAERDPEYAKKIHPHDRQRVTRALEVQEATGKAFSWWHARPVPPGPYRACKIGITLPLDELTPILSRRIDHMLAAGALDEARRALERCRNPAAPGWSGIGCAEIFRHLQGEISLDRCRELWLKNTRAYAKRQLTWFKADKDIRWFRPEETTAIADHVLRQRAV